MMRNKTVPILFALLAAALYAVSSPVSKLLLDKLSPAVTASMLYLGAGVGMLAVALIRKSTNKAEKELPLTKKELPYIFGMILLDIAAPIFLMLGLKLTLAANVSLLNNFEIVATSLIALFVFGEKISKRLWLAITLVTVSSVILSFEDLSLFSLSYGSLFVLLACVCWGFENNCTRKLSSKSPLETVVIKGFGSGIGSLAVAFIIGENITDIKYIPAALILGFFAYGLSIFFYIRAQRDLGAAKTSTYYAASPFIGAGLSLLIFRQLPSAAFLVSLAVMALGTYLAATDNK